MAARVCVNISATTLAGWGGAESVRLVCVCVCVFVYLCCVITFQSHRAGLDLLSGVLELDFFLPDRDETVHALLSEAAQLNQDETSNPPQMEEFWDKDREFAAISFASFGNRKGA